MFTRSGKLSFVLMGCFLVLITELGRVWQGVFGRDI